MNGQLTVIEGEATPPTIVISRERPISIGRSRENNVILLKDEHTSRLHAKVYWNEGRWLVEDFGRNGTRVNSQRVMGSAELDHGAELRIGDVRFRFSLPGQTTPGNGLHRISADSLPAMEIAPLSATRLQLDELTLLCQFMGQAVDALDPQELVKQGLSNILGVTGATLAGYMSLDTTDPLPKIVLPESVQLDLHLSRMLTRRIQREGKAVWLGGDSAPTRPTSESLNPFQDAICLPLVAVRQSLGALHVYKSNGYFAERDLRFCEALAGYLAHGLHVLKERRKLEAENTRLRSHLSTGDDLLGDSSPMVHLRSLIGRAAPLPYTVLIHGESGSGKELVALSLHRSSNRVQGPFVAVNCAAIPSSLMEAELFGYRRGAFSGADRDHPGLFQQADEGTLFLDEVGELSPDCQAKLLRVIESKTFRPIGATHEMKTDIRILAATNRNLEQDVTAGKFRQDLYFRLKVIEITVPPLRERPDDIPYLVQYFLDKLAVECHRVIRIAPNALQLLRESSWPGNVRQLRALLESSAAMSESDTIDAETIRRSLSPVKPVDGPPSLRWEEIEKWAIEKALKQTNRNITKAAELLEISRDTLHNKMKKYGIHKDSEITVPSPTTV